MQVHEDVPFWKRTSVATRLGTFISVATAIVLACFIIYQNITLTNAVQSVVSLAKSHLATAAYSSPTQKGSFEDQRASITRYMSKVDSLEDLSGKHEAAWSSMLSTPQGGFLWVKYNETNNMAWGVTMFHSIHCLTLLRSMLQMQLQNATSSQKAHANPTHQSSNHRAFDEGHVGHCFSYIAQQIMCAADDTIEPPWINKTSDNFIIDAGVSGEGYRHQCRDASLVWETVMQSEHEPIEPWNWTMGDTVQSVFGKKK